MPCIIFHLQSIPSGSSLCHLPTYDSNLHALILSGGRAVLLRHASSRRPLRPRSGDDRARVTAEKIGRVQGCPRSSRLVWRLWRLWMRLRGMMIENRMPGDRYMVDWSGSRCFDMATKADQADKELYHGALLTRTSSKSHSPHLPVTVQV